MKRVLALLCAVALIFTMSIVASAEVTNVAPQGTAFAGNEEIYGAGNEPETINDGENTTAGYQTKNAVDGAYIGLRFNGTVDVDSIILYWENSQYVAEYGAQYGYEIWIDGVQVTDATVVRNGNEPAVDTVTFSGDVSFSEIKLVLYKNGNAKYAPKLHEMEIYGEYTENETADYLETIITATNGTEYFVASNISAEMAANYDVIYATYTATRGGVSVTKTVEVTACFTEITLGSVSITAANQAFVDADFTGEDEYVVGILFDNYQAGDEITVTFSTTAA